MADDFEFDTTSDLALDEYANLEPAQINAADREFGSLLDVGRQRARKAEVRARHRLVIGLVVANTLKAAHHPFGPACHYSRAKGTYYGRSPYHPEWLTRGSLVDVVDAFDRAGLFETRRAQPADGGGGPQSTFAATERLLKRLAELGIERRHIRRDAAAAPVLILKDEEKRWIRYDPEDAHVFPMVDVVRAYNALLSRHQIALALDGVEREVAADSHGRAVDVTVSRVRRVFNNGSWEMGGRFFQGWWQRIPSADRRAIRIDGEETIELDYGGFLPRAIYHQEGIPLDGDPYAIPQIQERAEHRGMDWLGEVRPTLKVMFNVMVNATTNRGLNRIEGLILPKGTSRTEGYRLIAEHHAPIANWFYEGRGLSLMYRESKVCNRILMQAVQEEKVVLPIHDSFRVKTGDEAWIRDRMVEAYRREMNHDPVINVG